MERFQQLYVKKKHLVKRRPLHIESITIFSSISLSFFMFYIKILIYNSFSAFNFNLKLKMDQQHFQKFNRSRNEVSQKKKFIELIKKQNHKKLQMHGIKKKKKNSGFSSGQWNIRQTKLYFRYLSSHKIEFKDSQLRKKNKVFIKLADFIGSRTPDQCRSHHQKATRKFPIFQDLLNHYQQKINQQTKNAHLMQNQQKNIQIMVKQQPRMVLEVCKQEESLYRKISQQILIQEPLKVQENIFNHHQRVIPGIQGHQKGDKVTGLAQSRNYFEIGFLQQDNILIQIDFSKISEYQ